MKFVGLVAAVAAAFALVASSAHAIPRTFVSATGGGTACTRAAPCATFQAAHDATDLGGEINCLDAGSFGAVTISKSITIDCTGRRGESFATVGAITINSPLIAVRLRSLAVAAGTFPAAALTFINGAALFVENCVISTTSGYGLQFDAPAGVTARLFISDTLIEGNGGDGILISPSGSGSSRATFDRLRLDRNNIGIHASGSSGTGLIVTHFRNSVITGSTISGIRVFTLAGHSLNSMTLDRTSSTLNQGDGIFVSGPNAFVVLGRTTLIGNGQGITPDNGGNTFSYQNNHLTGNAIDGAPTGVLSLK